MKTTVLKFGGSVLQSEDDLPRAVHEIYKHWRRGSQTLVVVSAFGGATNELLRRAESLCGDPEPGSLAALLATGEAASAALLGLAVDRAGIPVKVLSPEQVGLVTEGKTLDAEPVAADIDRLRKELESSVVIVSGFVGLNLDGETTLLGRGGSDYTALFLAERLDARCVLVKDVDGLYESNPKYDGDRPRRYSLASWETALLLGGDVVQHKAVRFAQNYGLSFSITAPGSTVDTEIGDWFDSFDKCGQIAHPPLRVALLGCGTVGGGVYQRLASQPEVFEVVGVADRNEEKTISVGVPSEIVFRDANLLIERDCDVVIELFGRIEPTRDYIESALRRGRHVVTANKALLSVAGVGLQGLAEENGVTIRYSASVGGVLPALETISSERAVGEPLSVSGIVNGTCNFICDELAKGISFDDAVAAAQKAGFAEADPALDLNGTDAAQKLVLIVRESFGVTLPVESIKRQGIQDLTPAILAEQLQQGRTIRLVAKCTRTSDGFEATVRPTVLPSAHPFAQTTGADNCLVFENEDGGCRLVKGRGAGRWPTTEAVMADVFDVRGDVFTRRSVTEPLARFAEVSI